MLKINLKFVIFRKTIFDIMEKALVPNIIPTRCFQTTTHVFISKFARAQKSVHTCELNTFRWTQYKALQCTQYLIRIYNSSLYTIHISSHLVVRMCGVKKIISHTHTHKLTYVLYKICIIIFITILLYYFYNNIIIICVYIGYIYIF